jgi:uncharacterized protein YbjT (DUF2867 family)
MEILALPAFGLGSGVLTFFGAPERPIQLIAVDDIGRFAALAFEAPGTSIGETLELAGDELSSTQVVAAIGHALGRTHVPRCCVREAPAPREPRARARGEGAGSSRDVSPAQRSTSSPGVVSTSSGGGRI